MATPEYRVEVRHAACDVSSDTIFVEGTVGAGTAVCLMPRRYRTQPDWWVVEVATVDAPTEQAQGFRLSCPTEGMWGTEGIEIVTPGASTSQRIPRPAAATAHVVADQAEAAAEPDAAAELPKKLGGGTRILRARSAASADGSEDE